KSATPGPGAVVTAGQEITYTLTVSVANVPTQTPVVLQDVMGAGLEFKELGANPGGFVHDAAANTFTLPAGSPVGAHQVSYIARVQRGATAAALTNAVTGTAGGPDSDTSLPCSAACSTDHGLLGPAVTLSKVSNIDAGTAVKAGETLT